LGGLSEMISRLQKHKELKTWHFDKNSDHEDIYLVRKFDRPDLFWIDGTYEVLNETAVQVSYETMAKGQKNGTDDHSVAQNSLIVDLELCDAKPKDSWFERRIVTPNHILWEIVEELGLHGKVDARIATQRPKDGALIHIDHEHQQHYIRQAETGKSLDDIFASRGNWKKYIITLQNAEPGMVMCYGNTVLTDWKAGEAYLFNYGVPHWTTNFSGQERHNLMVTGELP